MPKKNKKSAPKKLAKKVIPKKITTKKAAAKKTINKKVAPKKNSVKKPLSKKTVSKKTVAKKPVVKEAIKKILTKTKSKPASIKLVQKTTNIQKISSNNKMIKSATNAVKKTGKVILPTNYKPTQKEEYMNSLQLEYFRQKLVVWKAELSHELTETLDNLKEENWQESDMTDRATVETDASLELRTRDRYRKLINKINEALARIEKGTYGYCEETGEEIGIKRLEARPIATLSIEAQERHERDERTHYDEDMEERLA